MRTTTKEEISEICLKKLDDLNFNNLIYNEEIFNNPYSLIHPGYLLYIWGKLTGSKNKFKKASEIFDSLTKGALDLHSYIDAGEFSISKIKAEGRLGPSSKDFKKSYKKSLKIFNSLVDLHKDPFFIDALIEVEELFERFSKIKSNIDKIEVLYRKAYLRYAIEAESIKIEELINIKILSFFEAVKYLDKINKSTTELDDFEKESILNRIISEITTQLDNLDNNENKTGTYSSLALRINLLYGLGRAYYLLGENLECKLYFSKCLSKINTLLEDKNLINSLLESKETLYREKEIYKIQGLEILTREFFEQVVITNEKIELMELKSRIISDLKKLNETTETEELKNRIQLVALYLNLIEFHEYEITNKDGKPPLIESIKEKYKAYCVFYCYQIIKILRS